MKTNNHLLNNPIMGYAHHRIILDKDENPIDYEFLEVNSTFEKITGLKAEKIIGKTVREVLPGIENSEFDWIGFYGKVALEGKEEEFEQYSELLKRWYRVYVYSTEMMYFSTIFIDITMQKKESAEILKLSQAVEQSSASVVITDLKGNIEYVNSKFSEVTGYTSEEVIGQNPRILKSGEHSQDYYKNLWDTITSGKMWKGEFHNKKKNGELYWESARISPIFDKNDKITNFLGVKEDITDRKRLEETYEKEHILLRTIIDSIPSAIYVKDKESRKILANKTDCVNCGVEKEEDLIGKNDFDLYPKEIADKFFKDDEQIIKNGIIKTDIEEKIVLPDGKTKWLLTNKIPLFNNKGEVEGLVGIGHDITQRKMMEEKLKESELKYKTLVELSPDAILVHSKGKIIYANSAAVKIFGAKDQSNLIGYSVINLVHPDLRDKILERIKVSLENHKIAPPLEEKLLRFDGTSFYAEVIANPITYDDQNAMQVIARDISERKKFEEEINNYLKNLEKINEELEIARNDLEEVLFEKNQLIEDLEATKNALEITNIEKDKFFSIISHDLRAPFNGFLGITKMMSEELSELSREEVQEFSKTLNEAAENLFRLLENLLSWSRLKRNVMDFNPEKLQIKELVESCYHPLKIAIKNKNQKVQINISEEIYVCADNEMSKTVMRNLISNASKFTHKGGSIYISASSENDVVTVSVKDTGIGIPEKMIDKLFNIGEKTSRKGTEKEPSTGLGLILCKEFIEKNGGKLWVESKEGVGTTFYFSLPLCNN